MRFLMLYTPDPNRTQQQPTAEHMHAMGKYIEESFKSGVLVTTGGLIPPAVCGGLVEAKNGDVSVKDGPFAEAKEVVGGFAILRVASKEDLIMHTKQFLKVAGDGKCEFRQIDDNSPDNVGPVKS
jgi:hypothetical protein